MVNVKAFPLILLTLLLSGCFVRDLRWKGVDPGNRPADRVLELKTTAYCHCKACCSWERNWYGKPVTRSGKQKKVRYTASNTYARPGTIAADTSLFPFGTILYIPGYGFGIVEDRGGAIKGQHVDLYFRKHSEAKVWGVQQKSVKVWFP